MLLVIFEQIKKELIHSEVLRVDWHLMLLVYLLRGWELIEIVGFPEVLVVMPDVLESDSQFSLIELLQLLI